MRISMLNRLSRRFIRSRDGSVILETALMITILLMLMFGIVDMGRALFSENNLVSAAREGARYAAIDPAVNGGTDTTKKIVKQHFSSFGDTLLDANIVRTTIIDGSGNIAAVRVTITYPFKWITPLPRLIHWTNGGSYTTNLHAQAEYRYEF